MATPTTTDVYGKVVSFKAKKDLTLKDPKIKGFKYPFEKTPGKGYFSEQAGLNLIKSGIKSLVRTTRGERFMLPDYGCNLKKFLMEPLDQTTFSLIKEEIEISIRKYLKAVAIEKLVVKETISGNLNVSLGCSLRDSEATKFGVGVRI